MKKPLATLLSLALPLALTAAPSVAHADGILFNFGVGPMIDVGGNFLGKPGDKTIQVQTPQGTATGGGTDQLYPGFSGTQFAYGAFVDLRLLSLVGVEVDFLRQSGKASGDISSGNSTGSLQITQTATHIPVLLKGVLPLPLVAPYIFVGPEFVFVSDNGANVSGDLGKGVTTNGAHSDNYKYWTFGFGMEIKLPIPDLDIRIPISIRGSVNPGVSDKESDRWVLTGPSGNVVTNIATNNQFQYQAQGTLGVGYYF